MAARDIVYGLTVKLKDKASRGLKDLRDSVERLGQAGRRAGGRMTRGGGLAGLLSGGLLGGFAGRTGAGGPSGGIGGVVSGVLKGATKLATMPLRIISGFSRLVPYVGGVFSGVLSTATNALQGIANVASNVIGGITNAFASLAKAAARAFGKVLSTATRVFGKISMYGGGAFAAGTAAAVKFAGDVENSWNKVTSIIDLGSVAPKIRKQLRDLAMRTGRGLTEVMQGYYQVISAGFREPQKAMKIMRTSLKGAVGGFAQFPTVVKTVSRTMRNFTQSVKGPTEAMDVLLKTVDLGQITMPELSGVFGRVANAASMAGAKFRETAAALGVMAQTGPAEVVATQLRGFFLALTKQTKQTKEALAQLKKNGLDVTRRALKRVGLVRYLQRLRRVPQDVLTQIFPDRRALMGVNTLMKMLPGVQNALQGLSKAGGKTKRNFLNAMDSLTRQASRAWQGLKDLAWEYAKPISDVLKEALKGLPDTMKQWRPVARKAGQAVAGVLDTVLEKGKGLYQWLAIRDWSKAWSGLTDLPSDLARNVLPQIQRLFGRMGKKGFQPGPIIEVLVGAFEWAAARIKGLMKVLWHEIGRDLKNALGDALRNWANDALQSLQKLKEKRIKEFFQEGTWATELDIRLPDEWEDMTEHQKDIVAASYGNLHPAQAQAMDAATSALSSIVEGAAMMPQASEREKSAAARVARARADKEAAKAAEKMAGALRDLEKEINGIRQSTKKTVAGTIPARKLGAGSEAAQRTEPTLRQRVKQSEEYEAAQSSIERQQQLAENLVAAAKGTGKKKYLEKARKVAESAREARELLEFMLTNIIADQKATEKELQRLQRSVKQLARAR